MAVSKRNYRAMKDPKLVKVYEELVRGGDARHRAVQSTGGYRDDLAAVQAIMSERGLPIGRDETEEEDEEPAGPRIPFSPMLALGKPSVEAAVGQRDCVMEPKADGWRLIVERDRGNNVRAWLRSGDEATHRLPHHVREWARWLPPDTVLDGELCLFHPDESLTLGVRPGSSHEVHTLMRRTAKDPTGEATHQLKFFVFDCLRYLGDDQIHRPLRERQEWVRKLFRDDLQAIVNLEHTYPMLPWREPPTEEGYARLVREGWEGAIVKDLDAPYAPGARTASVCKLKSKDTVDVVVMAVHEGNGEWGGMAGSLSVGQFDKMLTLVQRGSVGSGFTFPERQRIWDNRDSYVGQVLELRHMGVQAGGFRHPVFLRWRPDLRADQVDFHDGR